VPDIIRALLAERPVVIRNPEAIRPWQHVLDPLAGYLILAEKLCTGGLQYAESWNFGPREDDAKPVSWITQQLTELWGTDIRWRVDGHEHPHEAHYLKLDCSKATTRLGWRPQWDIHQALCAVVEWYKAYQSGENIRDLMMRQIQSYLGRLKEAAEE
jgi:CDP-glucose 4,6-dehydratase